MRRSGLVGCSVGAGSVCTALATVRGRAGVGSHDGHGRRCDDLGMGRQFRRVAVRVHRGGAVGGGDSRPHEIVRHCPSAEEPRPVGRGFFVYRLCITARIYAGRKIAVIVERQLTQETVSPPERMGAELLYLIDNR